MFNTSILPPSELCTPHREYLSLGKNPPDRQRHYHELFTHHVEGQLLEEIQTNTHKGMALGNDRFKEELVALTGRRLKSKKRGRSVGATK
jgi:putative transposase